MNQCDRLVTRVDFLASLHFFLLLLLISIGPYARAETNPNNSKKIILEKLSERESSERGTSGCQGFYLDRSEVLKDQCEGAILGLNALKGGMYACIKVAGSIACMDKVGKGLAEPKRDAYKTHLIMHFRSTDGSMDIDVYRHSKSGLANYWQGTLKIEYRGSRQETIIYSE